MSTYRVADPVVRRTVEAVLSVAMILLSADLFASSPVLAWESDATRLVLLVVLLVGPGLLALLVLARVIEYAARFASDEQRQPGDTALSRVLASTGLAVFACLTLATLLQGLPILFFVVVGSGIMLPIFPLLAGSALGVVVLIDAVLWRLFPEGPLNRLRGSIVE